MEATPLGPLERRVMAHLWRGGPATPREVLEALNATSDRKLAYTTILTILVRLDEKRYVTRARDGRQYRYAAAFAEGELRAEIGRRELRRLIERHGAGTLAGFAADLVGGDADLTARLRVLANGEAES